jgi:uncharacterized protein YcgI (DUF1989 family)
MSSSSNATPYAPNIQHTIPARSSVAVRLDKTQRLTVINTHGTQVVDFWAFVLPEPESLSTTRTHTTTTPLPIHLSMSHTRASTLHLSPLPGDTLVTNLREPILQLISDSTPGVHDTLIAACDRARYRQLISNAAEADQHANCVDNLHAAIARDTGSAYAFQPATTTAVATAPDPLNLFMNIPVTPLTLIPDVPVSGGAQLSFEPPRCGPGANVVFEAVVDCLVVMSACPQDRVKVNNMAPTEAHFIVHRR